MTMRNAGTCLSLITAAAIFAAVLAIASPYASAGGVVSGVTGPIVQRGAITVAGSAFGPAPNVVLFDDFEGGTAGDTIMTGPGSAAIGQWSYKDPAGTPYYSDDSAVSGAMSFRADMSITHPQYVAAMLPADTHDFFMSWWMYVPAGENIPGEGTQNSTNWKTVWVQGTNTTDDDVVCPVILATSMIITGNDTPYTRYLSLDFQKGQWKRVWMWNKGGYSNDGQCYYWELRSTGVSQRVNDNNVSTMYPGGIRERVHINGYGRTTPNCHTGFDDVYIATGANARARVEIGNNAVYNDCTQLAICPTTGWSDTSITAMCNVGGLSGGPWYLFVVDADGTASSGYQLSTPTYTLTVNSGAGGGEYYAGEVVNVLADEPATDMLFDEWTGDTAGLASTFEASTTYTMPAGAAEITATYMPAVYYDLTVNSGTGGGQYSVRQVVAISADAAPSGWIFAEWTGDTANLADPQASDTTVTMPAADVTVTAAYIATYVLTVNSGTGSGTYTAGQVIAISADTAPVGQTFDAWTGDVGGVADVNAADTTITMPAADATVTASYTALPTYNLTVNSGSGGGQYWAGQVVAVSADAAPSGQVFDAWIGDTAGLADVAATSTTYTMPASDAEITASYRAAVTYNLIVNSGSGSGAYPEGSVVEIAADAAPVDYVFTSWTGDVADVADPLAADTTVTMPSADVELTATYSHEAQTMKFRAGGGAGFVDAAFDDTWVQYDPADDTTHGDEGWDGLRAGVGHAYLIAVKDLFTLLPKTTGGWQLRIADAKLHFWRYSGSSSRILSIYRMTTDWLPGAAGTNENNVSGMYAVRSTATRWASGGDFSSSDYDTSVVSGGPWGDYAVPQPELVYTVTDQIADMYDAEANYGLCVEASSNIIGRASEYGTLEIRPYLEVSYYYEQVGYVLTVNSGTGSGSYAAGTVVNIDADAAPSGQVFDAWTGEVSGVADTAAASTTITMPAADATVTATYKAASTLAGDLSGDGFVGQDDLDIVLDQWGHGAPPNAPITDPRADASGDGFVGQDDLDIVLDDWGKSAP